MAKKTHHRKTPAAKKHGGVFLHILLGITVAAFILRLVVSGELGAINYGLNSVYSPSKLTDLATYMDLAQQIVRGEYSGVFYYQPFYYAVFLPAIYLICNSIKAVIFSQSLIGALTVFLSGLCGAKLFGKKAGLFAALLCAVSTPLLLYTPYHQNETLQTFNLTWLFYLTLCALGKWSTKRWFWVGIFSGVAILTRGNIWLLLPVIFAALIFDGIRLKKQWDAVAAMVLVMLLAALLVQLPFIWHNSKELGRLSGPSTAADAVLALGNTPEAPAGGRNPGLPAGPMEYPEAYHQWMSSGKSSAQNMLNWLKEEPGAFLELQFRKLLLFWDYREIPNNVSLYGEGEHSRTLQLLLIGRSCVLIPLGLAGLFLFMRRTWKRRSLRLGVLYGFILFYWGTIAAFYILSRFRAPILPLLAIPAGGFIGLVLRQVADRTASRRKDFLLLSFTALVAGLWFSISGYDTYRSHWEPGIMRLVRPDGTRIKGCIFDHGPFTFGDWQERPLKTGTIFSKKFAKAPEKGDVEVSFFSQAGATLKLRINGKEYTEVLPPGLQKKRFPATLLGDEVSFEVLNAIGEPHIVCDTQRFYERSTYNGKILEAEWVMRLYSTK
jgi:4-amino-4-deoxy-L-arabinose transferase-like glycosyltransferase